MVVVKILTPIITMCVTNKSHRHWLLGNVGHENASSLVENYDL